MMRISPAMKAIVPGMVILVGFTAIPQYCGCMSQRSQPDAVGEWSDERESRELQMEILSARRVGRGARDIEFVASFTNTTDKANLKFSEYGSYKYNFVKDGGRRVLYLSPEDFITPTFTTGYIDGDEETNKRWIAEEEGRKAWLDGVQKDLDVELTLGYKVPSKKLFHDFDNNYEHSLDYKYLSPKFTTKLLSSSKMNPPISIDLVSARIKQDGESISGRDQIEYTIRIESTSKELVALDILKLTLYIMWDDENTGRSHYTLGVEMIPAPETANMLEKNRFLIVPPEAVRIATFTTSHIGDPNYSVIYPERIDPPETPAKPEKDITGTYWINRVAEKYLVGVIYDLPRDPRDLVHPNLVHTGYFPEEFDELSVYSDCRETDLGQTRFIGEAWLEPVGTATAQ